MPLFSHVRELYSQNLGPPEHLSLLLAQRAAFFLSTTGIPIKCPFHLWRAIYHGERQAAPENPIQEKPIILQPCKMGRNAKSGKQKRVFLSQKLWSYLAINSKENDRKRDRATMLSRILKIAENMYKLAPTQNWTDHHLQRRRIRVEESYEKLLAQPGLNPDGQSPEIDGRSGLVWSGLPQTLYCPYWANRGIDRQSARVRRSQLDWKCELSRLIKKHNT